MGQATVGDEVEVLFHHRCVHAQHTSRHSVAGVLDLECSALKNHLGHFFLELFRPKMWVFQFDLVDHVDTKVQMHRLVTEDVLELLRDACHLVAAAHRQDLREAAIEKDALRDAIETNQVAQQLLVSLDGAGAKVGVGQLVRMTNRPRSLFRYRRHLAIHIEYFAFIHAEGLDAVLVCVRMDRLLKGLTQQILPALGIGDQAVDAQHQVIGHQRIRCREISEGTHHDAALVLAQTVAALPCGDVSGHVDFLRHPVVGAAVEVLLPSPVVLEGHELIEVSAAVDHRFLINRYA